MTRKPIKRWVGVVAGLAAASFVATACSSAGGGNSSANTGSTGDPSTPATQAAAPTGGGSASASATLTPVKVGMLVPGAAGGFVNMAQEKGYYKDCGVDLQVITMSSGAQLAPALVSNSIDIAIEGPAQMLIATEKDAVHAKIIGSVEDGLPWAIYAKKSITSLAQLKGKSMAVSSSTGLPEVIAQLILKKNGVDPNTLKYVNSGSNADYYKAVVNGVVDSASAPSDYIPQAKKDGINVLATAAKEVPLYPRWTIIGTDSFLQAHPDAAACYLAAMMRGERYAFDHPDEAKALAAKTMGGATKADDPVVVDMYNQIVNGKLINRNAELPLNKLDYQQQNLVDLGLIKSKLPLDKVYDDQYRQAALKMVGGAQ